ncbi:MAG: NAD-dependent DNA ligase LigA, partial [Clostridiales bacterium]|nr:NAD-dependent DNA ligase LigA [Clostridiales bacterium]
TSRTGLINPIAVFEPVELEGTTVNRASLHNLSIVEALELGIGDTIEVYKANMIIPQVLDNITRAGGLPIPDKCPVCGASTEILKLKESKSLFCKNPNCKAQVISFLGHFTSRDAMNIEGLSEATLEKFVAEGFINNYLDIFYLDRYEDRVKSMEGFGERSFNKLAQSIGKSKNIALPNFIFALGINQVGLSNAKLLCSHFKYDTDKIASASKEELESIEGYGGVISEQIFEYFRDEENLRLFNEALKILNIIKPVENEAKLQGFTFVITGSLDKFSNRKGLQNEIEKLGGKVTSSVTNKTNYLINNDNGSTSSKNKKANELNIPIISEDAFIDMFL